MPPCRPDAAKINHLSELCVHTTFHHIDHLTYPPVHFPALPGTQILLVQDLVMGIGVGVPSSGLFLVPSLTCIPMSAWVCVHICSGLD